MPAVLVCLLSACASTPVEPALPPAPASLEAFRVEVQKVLTESGIPGAGIALVRQSGIEWAGGVGFADRDAKTPISAETHFRVGSISKTFVAMALVQLSLEDTVNLEESVTDLLPDLRMTNPWAATDPVRVIHLLQHTAGFDDMHFNELYNVADPPDMPLDRVLAINPRSRVVRWRPGTRMAYSNPGYTVAAAVLEHATGEPYENTIRQRIFDPTGMKTSSFRLTPADLPLLAKGYDTRGGPPVPYSQIYLRPAGNLHSSPAELGAFVHMLLNWGELPDKLVVDPEYLSNMEHPRTTLASHAGLLNGYGSGIFSYSKEPFPLLGHDGGIEGFQSRFAYSPSRDVGFVILLNGTYGRTALDRISTLAIEYLKADVEPPAKPEAPLDAAFVDRYVGYYQPAAPRAQVLAFRDWLVGGVNITNDGGRLYSRSFLGKPERLIPVGQGLFRLEREVEATRVFTTDEDGQMVFTGPFYAVRGPRWRVEIVRIPVLTSLVIVMTPLVLLLAWLIHARRAKPQGFWGLKTLLLLAPMGILLIVGAASTVPDRQLGQRNAFTLAMWAGTVVIPVSAIGSFFATLLAWARGAGRWLRRYALMVSVAALIVSAYFYAWGMVGLRPWDF